MKVTTKTKTAVRTSEDRVVHCYRGFFGEPLPGQASLCGLEIYNGDGGPFGVEVPANHCDLCLEIHLRGGEA